MPHVSLVQCALLQFRLPTLRFLRFHTQFATKGCIAKTLKILEEKNHGKVSSHLIYLMCVEDKVVQRKVSLALAHLCSPNYLSERFIENNDITFNSNLLVQSGICFQITMFFLPFFVLCVFLISKNWSLILF